MKKMIFFVLATLSFLLTGCGYQSKVTPLAGNPTLSSFTELAEDGETVLTGVAQPQSGHVVIPPAKYSEITADGYVITCKEENESFTLFKNNGEKIGNFEMVTPWQKNGNYYLGVKYINKTYYFPETDLVLTTQYCYTDMETLYMSMGDHWLVLDYYGKVLNKLPNEFTILKDAKNPLKTWIAIWEKGKKYPACELYGINGEKYKKLPYVRWVKLFKNVVNEPLSSNVFVGTAKDFDKF